MKTKDWLLIAIIFCSLIGAVGVYAHKVNIAPLDQDVRGKAIPAGLVPSDTDVVAVIHPECPYCVRSVEAWNELASQGVKLVGVSRGTPEEAAEFVELSGAQFPIVITPDSEWEQQLGLKGVPYTLMIEGEREIASAYMGWVRSPEPVRRLLR